jgi:hypothetical protein
MLEENHIYVCVCVCVCLGTQLKFFQGLIKFIEGLIVRKLMF